MVDPWYWIINGFVGVIAVVYAIRWWAVRDEDVALASTDESNEVDGNQLLLAISEHPSAHEIFTDLVYVGHRRVSIVPSTIARLVNTRGLDLRCNVIQCLPVSIGALHNLHTLDVHDNKLAELPATLCTLVNLRRLDVRKNCLSSLPLRIDKLLRLSYLDAEDNLLSVLPDAMQKLVNLTFCNVRRNRLPAALPAWLTPVHSLHAVIIWLPQLK